MVEQRDRVEPLLGRREQHALEYRLERARERAWLGLGLGLGLGLDLRARVSVPRSTAAKPSQWKLISPALHIMTPPHMGTIDAYASREYCLPVIEYMSAIVKSGPAAVTIWAKET